MRRIGKIKVSRDAIDKVPEAVRAVMAKVIILRAEYMLCNETIEYIALCEEFDEVDIAVFPPDYEVLITTHYNEEYEITGYDVKFERR